MFQATTKTFPFLKARAAEIKHLASALRHVWEMHCDTSKEHHRTISLVFIMIEKIEEILDTYKNEFQFPQDVAKESLVHGH